MTLYVLFFLFVNSISIVLFSISISKQLLLPILHIFISVSRFTLHFLIFLSRFTLYSSFAWRSWLSKNRSHYHWVYHFRGNIFTITCVCTTPAGDLATARTRLCCHDSKSEPKSQNPANRFKKTDFWKQCQTWTALPDTESPPKYLI